MTRKIPRRPQGGNKWGGENTDLNTPEGGEADERQVKLISRHNGGKEAEAERERKQGEGNNLWHEKRESTKIIPKTCVKTRPQMILGTLSGGMDQGLGVNSNVFMTHTNTHTQIRRRAHCDYPSWGDYIFFSFWAQVELMQLAVMATPLLVLCYLRRV